MKNPVDATAKRERIYLTVLTTLQAFMGEGHLEGLERLSEVARHEERETKQPMTHPMNIRILWISSGPMNCLCAKRSQLFLLVRVIGVLSFDTVWSSSVSGCL